MNIYVYVEIYRQLYLKIGRYIFYLKGIEYRS